MHRRSFLKIAMLGGLLPAIPTIGLGKTGEIRASGIRNKNITLSDKYFHKMRHPDDFHDGDVTTDLQDQHMMMQLSMRLEQVQKFVGYGNFSILSLDKMLHYGRRYSQIGTFEKSETDFLEKLFYEDAIHYGFYGEKPLTNITETIKKRSIEKIPHTGQYLFRGEPIKLYSKIKQDIGDTITLTSGVRGVIKQMQLFLRKTSRCEGNLSLASRSLAPPGYSFHGIGDFDVGRTGLGAQNFTPAFAKTDEFKKLTNLGYINMRYLKDNELGVRFEPWHIKVL